MAKEAARSRGNGRVGSRSGRVGSRSRGLNGDADPVIHLYPAAQARFFAAVGTRVNSSISVSSLSLRPSCVYASTKS